MIENTSIWWSMVYGDAELEEEEVKEIKKGINIKIKEMQVYGKGS